MGATVDDRIVVWLGNRQAVDEITDPDDVAAAKAEGRAPRKLRRPLPGKRCTTVTCAADATGASAFIDIAGPRGIWQAMSDAPAPAWVASTRPGLADVLAAHWGGIEVREPQPEG